MRHGPIHQHHLFLQGSTIFLSKSCKSCHARLAASMESHPHGKSAFGRPSHAVMCKARSLIGTKQPRTEGFAWRRRGGRGEEDSSGENKKAPLWEGSHSLILNFLSLSLSPTSPPAWSTHCTAWPQYTTSLYRSCHHRHLHYMNIPFAGRDKWKLSKWRWEPPRIFFTGVLIRVGQGFFVAEWHELVARALFIALKMPVYHSGGSNVGLGSGTDRASPEHAS